MGTGISPLSSPIIPVQLYKWIKCIPEGTRENDGLQTGIMGVYGREISVAATLCKPPERGYEFNCTPWYETTHNKLAASVGTATAGSACRTVQRGRCYLHAVRT